MGSILFNSAMVDADDIVLVYICTKSKMLSMIMRSGKRMFVTFRSEAETRDKFDEILAKSSTVDVKNARRSLSFDLAWNARNIDKGDTITFREFLEEILDEWNAEDRNASFNF